MTLDEIRKIVKRQPFEAFEVLLVDGRSFRVPHPDFIFVPPLPKSTWVIVAGPRGLEHVNTAVISSIRPARGGRRRRRAG